MKARIFSELQVIEDMARVVIERIGTEYMARVNLKVGDRFLTGTQIIAQKENKKIGDMVTYYLVTHSDTNGKNVSYKPVYEKLEE